MVIRAVNSVPYTEENSSKLASHACALNESFANGCWLTNRYASAKAEKSRTEEVGGKSLADISKDIAEMKPHQKGSALQESARPMLLRYQIVLLGVRSRDPEAQLLMRSYAFSFDNSDRNFQLFRYIRQSQLKPENLVHGIGDQFFAPRGSRRK